MIYCAYTRLGDTTKISLLQYGEHAKFIDLSNCNSDPLYQYSSYLSQRWKERKTFLNVEHDVVPWPGAIDSIINCPFPWCGFGYHPREYLDERHHMIPLGCVKFSDEFIRATKNIFPADIEWMALDRYITIAGLANNISFHQHFPACLNANPSQLT